MPKQPRPATDDHVHDVVVVGGGPAGSSCAYWLADAGWDVVVVEKKQFPRVKTCGDGLTPRAVRQLADMGLERHAGRRPPLHRPPRLRLRPVARARMAVPPRLPVVRLHDHPPRPRRARRRARREGRRDDLAGRGSRRADPRRRGEARRCGHPACRPGVGGGGFHRRAVRRPGRRVRRGVTAVLPRRGRERQGDRRDPGRPRPLRRRRRRLELPVRPRPRHRPATRTTRSAWRCAATTGRRGTTTR